MAKYKLSKEAKKDLIRIHHYGVANFGIKQVDKYFYSFFDQFEIIAERPFSFEQVNHIKDGYRRSVLESDSIYFRMNKHHIEIMTIIVRQDVNSFI